MPASTMRHEDYARHQYSRSRQCSKRWVEPVIAEPVIHNDPDDDAVLYTAVEGHADVICTRDRDFYSPEVIAFCRQRGIAILNEIELLRLLRT